MKYQFPATSAMTLHPGFELHPQLRADTLAVGDWPLSRVLLMNDTHYPWLILVPRRPGLREIYELPEGERQQLMRESCLLASTLMRLFTGDKLNVAALGNMVPQLHLHHIVRRVGDPAWPAPVWGRHPAQPYLEAAADDCLALLRRELTALLPLQV
ncbi:Diadenosine tetraphosphate (Ap4A) hydrolase [Solimonas aquatica]|uniref:Diadenosine tetraphosphate (Ap4A) hydrolase n=1 Tax=Solimonas aquatica TaxID=489703 RepID=A0A1H9J6R7_9GAMM|nr:HIT domain-containing protein [Solimonas aquatica]SEQ82560.1 Diadenosine tetraphosphate (Ap4A) hydrolase [Solimonas aquatica]